MSATACTRRKRAQHLGPGVGKAEFQLSGPVSGQECAYRDANDMVDPVVAGRVCGIEEHRPEDRRMAGIQELSRRKLTIVDREAPGGGLLLQVGSKVSETLAAGSIELPANFRHAFGDGDHGPQRLHCAGLAEKLDVAAAELGEHRFDIAFGRIERKDRFGLGRTCFAAGGLEEAFLVVEVDVERAFRDPGLAGDLSHARRVKTLGEKNLVRAIEYLPPFGAIQWLRRGSALGQI